MIGQVSAVTAKILLGVAVVIGFLYAGSMDFEETVIGTMTQEKYQFIRERVGDDRSAIVKEYLDKRDYYDSIDYYYLYR